MAYLMAPNGKRIVATLEVLYGEAGIMDVAPPDADGEHEIEYDGETDVYWDGQMTVREREKGARIFLDEDRNEWPESKLQRIEEPME